MNDSITYVIKTMDASHFLFVHFHFLSLYLSSTPCRMQRKDASKGNYDRGIEGKLFVYWNIFWSLECHFKQRLFI